MEEPYTFLIFPSLYRLEISPSQFKSETTLISSPYFDGCPRNFIRIYRKSLNGIQSKTFSHLQTLFSLSRWYLIAIIYGHFLTKDFNLALKGVVLQQ